MINFRTKSCKTFSNKKTKMKVILTIAPAKADQKKFLCCCKCMRYCIGFTYFSICKDSELDHLVVPVVFELRSLENKHANILDFRSFDCLLALLGSGVEANAMRKAQAQIGVN